MKSGYWNLSFFNLTDQVGNMRYENTSTLGMKLYIESPLEDIVSPQFNHDFFQEYTEDYIVRRDSNYSGVKDSVNGTLQKAIHYKFSWEEMSEIRGTNLRIKFPNSNDSELYYKEAGGYTIDNDVTKKVFDYYFLIPEYFPTGYYKPTYGYTGDEAGNSSDIYFVDDPENFYIDPSIQPPKTFKVQRDSIYVKTQYPDIKSPEIDINNIYIKAEPTNPKAPDGETRVDIEIFARDYSDFEGKESGIQLVSFMLRDPQGKEFGYQTGNATMNHPDLPNGAGGHEPRYGDDWKVYRFNMVLPKGSAPGKWGLASAAVTDLVGNTRKYSFTEYVRFDVIESEVELEEPLEIEIMDKVINAGNVNSIKVKMSCVPCKGLNYVATIYSRFGGGSVVRNEGTLDANEVIVENLNTEGILDGEVNLTVQLLDQEFNLITTKTTKYTKDVIYPSAYYTRSNLQDEGTSNLDDIVIDVVYNTEDEGGVYNLEIGSVQVNADKGLKTVVSKNTYVPLKTIVGDLIGETSSGKIDFNAFSDGIIYTKLILTDPNGNTGEPKEQFYYKRDGILTYIGENLNDINVPTTSNIEITVTEQVTSTITLQGSDVDGDILTYSIVSGPSNGTASIEGNILNYTSSSDTAILDSVTYKANDGISDSNVSTITITITPVNDAPTNNGITANTDEDNEVSITLLGTDIDGDNLTYSTTDPTNGTISEVNGVVTYTPNANFNGTDTFTYTASDGTLVSSSATVTITVTPVNDAPLAAVVSDTTTEDNAVVITLLGTDIDGHDLTYSTTNPTNGTISEQNGVVTYTPNANFNGTDTFTYTASDGTLVSSSATVTITVTPVNDAPLAAVVSDTTTEDNAVVITLLGTDIDGHDLTYSTTNPTNGTISEQNGVVTYTPNANFNGTDTFTYTANDGTLDSESATVTVTVISVNDAPITSSLSLTVDEQVSASIELLASDLEGDSLTYSIVSGPTNGNASIEGNILIYNSTSDTATADEITYRANDGKDDSNESTVSIVINPINDAPTTLQTTSIDVSEATALEMLVATLDASDPEGTDLTYQITSGNEEGVFELTSNELKLASALDYETTTSYELIIEASDGALTSTSTLTINVIDVPNQSVEETLYITVYDVVNEDNTSRVDYTSMTQITEGDQTTIYEISGGEDAALFTINSQTGALNFINAPDFENPSDANADNIYEVTIKITNINDGAPEVPVVTIPTSIAVPEANPIVVEEITTIVVAETEDTDNDGVPDVEDNCPLTANPDQADFDNDGVGDVCDDSDNDGYIDAVDSCPNSPFGAMIDTNGCELFNLPQDNYTVEVTSATCVDTSNGAITISAQAHQYTYLVKVVGEGSVTLDQGNNIYTIISGEDQFELNTDNEHQALLTNITAGTYEICFTVAGEENYQQCYSVQIGEPQPLSASSKVNYSSRTVNLSMSGSELYTVTVNGKSMVTADSSINVNLKAGMNTIEITTDLDCQGSYFEEIFVSEEVLAYPNPTRDWVQLYVGGVDHTTTMILTDVSGYQYFVKEVAIPQNRVIELNLSDYPTGMYFIRLGGSTVQSNLKVIKE